MTKPKYTKGERFEDIFYKVMGDDLWYCRYCGHGHTDDEIKKMIKSYADSVRSIQNAVRSSRVAGK